MQCWECWPGASRAHYTEEPSEKTKELNRKLEELAREEEAEENAAGGEEEDGDDDD